jgi:hypothetical protein
MKPIVKPRAPTAAPTTNSSPPAAAQPTRPSAGTTIGKRAHSFFLFICYSFIIHVTFVFIIYYHLFIIDFFPVF